MGHLYWHKPQLVVPGSRIEGLPDDHPSKARCLDTLSLLFDVTGNDTERKRLLIHALKLWREQENDSQVARTLRTLSDANRMLGRYKEGIQQVKEALETYERLNDRLGQARCLDCLARVLLDDKQLDAAEEAVFRAINLLPNGGQQFLASQCHRLLGDNTTRRARQRWPSNISK